MFKDPRFVRPEFWWKRLIRLLSAEQLFFFQFHLRWDVHRNKKDQSSRKSWNLLKWILKTRPEQKPRTRCFMTQAEKFEVFWFHMKSGEMGLLDQEPSSQGPLIHITYCIICHHNRYKIIGGSLEVKLPTIWRDEKQSRAEAQRRGRLEERR